MTERTDRRTDRNAVAITALYALQAILTRCKKHKMTVYTVSQKKRPTLKLSVTLSNLNRFSKFLHYYKAYKICYKYQYNISHLTLGMLLHYLGKLEFKFSADIQRIWKKMQTNCILSAPILIPLRV